MSRSSWKFAASAVCCSLPARMPLRSCRGENVQRELDVIRPCLCGGAGLLQQLHRNPLQQIRLLGQGYESTRGHQRATWVMPASEDLKSGDAATAQFHEGLEMRQNLIAVHRDSQFGLCVENQGQVPGRQRPTRSPRPDSSARSLSPASPALRPCPTPLNCAPRPTSLIEVPSDSRLTY